MLELIYPQWPAPTRIRAVSTTRHRGISKAPYESLNLGSNVGDTPQDVAHNRQILTQTLNCSDPVWLKQTHSNTVYHDTGTNPTELPVADAAITTHPKQVLAVLTGDCVPIVLAHHRSKAIAAIHAGWRGLANNIIEKTLNDLPGSPSDYVAWIGPCISEKAYEIGPECKEALCNAEPAFANAIAERDKHLFANLPAMAATKLTLMHVQHTVNCGLCTYHDSRFFSYRRMGQQSGRMATLIWISET